MRANATTLRLLLGFCAVFYGEYNGLPLFLGRSLLLCLLQLGLSSQLLLLSRLLRFL